MREFADGDGSGWVDAALVDPFLDALEVDGGHVDGEAGGGVLVCVMISNFLEDMT